MLSCHQISKLYSQDNGSNNSATRTRFGSKTLYKRCLAYASCCDEWKLKTQNYLDGNYTLFEEEALTLILTHSWIVCLESYGNIISVVISIIANNRISNDGFNDNVVIIAQRMTTVLSAGFRVYRIIKGIYNITIQTPQHPIILQDNRVSLCKKASNHHANLPLEMYSFTL